MNRKLLWRLLGLVVGIAALVVVGVVAYHYGVNAGQNGTEPIFGPVRGYGRMMGFDAGYGLWGLIPILFLGVLLVGIIAFLVTPVGRTTPPSTSPTPGVGVDGLRELTEMHSRGELTDDEFTAAKRRLLGL